MFIVIWSCLTEFNELVTVVLPHWINRAVEAEARADLLIEEVQWFKGMHDAMLDKVEELERENERLEKALEAVCAQIVKHKPHCPGKLYLSHWPECEKCPRDTVCCDDWKQWALEKAEQALEGSDK